MNKLFKNFRKFSVEESKK
ncbi:hypothetical protein [Chryseobacterium sp. ERMR1:04]